MWDKRRGRAGRAGKGRGGAKRPVGTRRGERVAVGERVGAVAPRSVALCMVLERRSFMVSLFLFTFASIVILIIVALFVSYIMIECENIEIQQSTDLKREQDLCSPENKFNS